MAGREHMVRNEIAVLRKISMGHENILTLVDYFETVNSCTLVLASRLTGSVPDHRSLSGRRVI
jgi:calcium/calmodulin-dependent protein kinase I